MTDAPVRVESLPVLGEKKREIERRIRAREFVFGIQDGLISTVGLLSGVSAATQSRRVVLVTGIAAAMTGGISMAVGSYLSTLTERDIFEKELLDQERRELRGLVREVGLQALGPHRGPRHSGQRRQGLAGAEGVVAPGQRGPGQAEPQGQDGQPCSGGPHGAVSRSPAVQRRAAGLTAPDRWR